MSVKLRPGKLTLLKLGSYYFTRKELKIIYELYVDEGMSLWEIKECEVSHFNEASIEEIAQAICHAQWDIIKLPYTQRPTHTFHPDSIDLDEFNVGNSYYNKT